MNRTPTESTECNPDPRHRSRWLLRYLAVSAPLSVVAAFLCCADATSTPSPHLAKVTEGVAIATEIRKAEGRLWVVPEIVVDRGAPPVAAAAFRLARCEPPYDRIEVLAENRAVTVAGFVECPQLPLPAGSAQPLLTWQVTIGDSDRRGSVFVGDGFVSRYRDDTIQVGFVELEVDRPRARITPGVRTTYTGDGMIDLRAVEIAVFEVTDGGDAESRTLVHRWAATDIPGMRVDFSRLEVDRSADHHHFEIDWKVVSDRPRPFTGNAWLR